MGTRTEEIGHSVLRVVFKLTHESDDSGVFIRIPEKPTEPWMPINHGYEVEIGNWPDDYSCTGVLYSLTKAMARSNIRFLIFVLAGVLCLVRSVLSPIALSLPQASQEEIQQLIQRGYLAAARAQLDQALKQFPSEPGFYNLLGVVDAEQGNYRASESDFKRALAYAPKSASIYLNLAHLYQRMEDKEPKALGNVLAAYRSVLAIDARNVEALKQSGLIELLRGSFRSSASHILALPAPSRNQPESLAILCADQARLGEHARSEATADRLLSSETLAEADVLRVLPVLETTQTEGLEVELLEGLVTRGLASTATLQRLSSIYVERGELDRSRGLLEQAAAQEPDSTALLLALARVANQQGDYKGALGYLAHARDLEPQNASVHFFFGMVCVEENLAQEAYEPLKKAVTLNPENPYYNYAFGAVAVERDDPRESVPYFAKYRLLRPEDPRGRFALGMAYYYSHDLASARRELEMAVRYKETQVGSYYFLARVANEEGNLEEALRQIHKCLAVNPDYADGYAELGTLEMKEKLYTQAEEALQRAVEIDPRNYTANLNLMVLYQRTNDPRAKGQAETFEKIKSERAERMRDFLRTIEIRP